MTAPIDEIYKQIRARYDFELPKEYRHASDAGWFAFDDDKNGVAPSYLWLNDMEWLGPSEIRDHVFPSYCKPGFVPFAFTAGGDHWCWYPAESIDGVAPVVLCPHDSNTAEFYAPNFLGALYRQVLDYASSPIDDEQEARSHLIRWIEIIGPMFPFAWRETLKVLQATPLRCWEVGLAKRRARIGLLPPEEYRAIVLRDLFFAKLDTNFRWMFD